MLHHVVPEVIPNQVRVPPVVVQQALHSVGSGVARLLGQLPAVLVLCRAEQSPQIGQSPAARLRSPEPGGDALMHSFDAICPPGHFRYFISPNNHCLTLSLTDCLYSNLS